MIKINLAERKAPKAKKVPTIKIEGGKEFKNILLAGIFIAGFIYAGGWWYLKNRAIEDWKKRNQEAQVELKRLEEVRKKGEYYKQQKALLERQIQLVTELKKKQTVPVHILDQISKNLPDFLWLESMSAQSNQLNITGKATTYNAVSNFYNNLNASGFFQDVVLGRASEGTDGISFSLMCRFAPASEEPGVQES